MPTPPRPESWLPWDPQFSPPQLDTGLLGQVTGALGNVEQTAQSAVTGVVGELHNAEQAVTGGLSDAQAAANALNQGIGQATQIGSVVADTATAAATAAVDAASAAVGAAKAAGGVVEAVVPIIRPAASATPAAPTAVPGGGLLSSMEGDLATVVEQAALGAAKSAAVAALPGLQKAIEARVASAVQREAIDLLTKLEGGQSEPAVPDLADFIHADGRAAAIRTLLIGVVLSGLWGLVNVLGNIATVDWHNRDALPQVLSIAVTGVVGAVVAYVGRLAKPPSHIANAVIVPGSAHS